jgi:hypothetical protein
MKADTVPCGFSHLKGVGRSAASCNGYGFDGGVGVADPVNLMSDRI